MPDLSYYGLSVKTRSAMSTCLQEMIHGVNINVQENGSSSGSTFISFTAGLQAQINIT